MASVKKRGDVYRARYRDDAGHEHARHFARRTDAQQWLNDVTTAVGTGTYVDPNARRVAFSTYYADWSQRQVWEQTTVSTMDSAARSVTFGDIPLNRIRKSHIESWVKGHGGAWVGTANHTLASQPYGHGVRRCGR